MTLFDLESYQPSLKTEPVISYNLIEGANRLSDYVTWTSDSKWVAYTEVEVRDSSKRPSDQTGIYILDRNGQKGNVRITNFEKEFDTFLSQAVKWSFDNRYLAIGVSTSKRSINEDLIYIYDTFENSMILVCPVEGKLLDRFIWSSDNRYIAYSSRSPENIYGNLNIWDLHTGDVYQLATMINQLGGWSVKYRK